MGDVIDALLARDDVGMVAPTPGTDIDAVLQHWDALMPELLVKLWRASDGLTLEALDAHLLGTSEILQLLGEGAWSQELVERGFVPLLDDHQSNYLALIVRDPLAFRVVYVPHDDESRLLYRDFESCLHSLLAAMNTAATADMLLRKTPGDYAPDAPRSAEDQEAARALMSTDGDYEEWNHAAQLLDAGNLPEWAQLLETDHFVRRDVRARMQKMTSPGIRELLQQDEKAFEEFAELAAGAAQAAGIEVGPRQGHLLQLGDKWVNLEAFFYRRNIPDAMPRLAAWFEDLMAGRNPRQRNGHFMMD